MVIRINVINRATTCFLTDFREQRIDTIVHRLRFQQLQVLTHPLHVLTILFEEHSFATEKARQQLDDEVGRMERRTGMTSLVGAYGSKGHEIDHEGLVRELHACNANLIFLDNSLEFEAEMGKFCKVVFVKFEELQARVGAERLEALECDKMVQTIDYWINSSHFRRVQTGSLKNRVKTQINVVSDIELFCVAMGIANWDAVVQFDLTTR
jgi:hypothetical protein